MRENRYVKKHDDRPGRIRRIGLGMILALALALSATAVFGQRDLTGMALSLDRLFSAVRADTGRPFSAPDLGGMLLRKLDRKDAAHRPVGLADATDMGDVDPGAVFVATFSRTR